MVKTFKVKITEITGFLGRKRTKIYNVTEAQYQYAKKLSRRKGTPVISVVKVK